MNAPVRLPKRYEFVRELGRGGMAAVYEAIDLEGGGARVAIKTLPSSDPVAIARFKREFRTLADLHHPNLVTLGELFCEDGQWAFSMELVCGVDFIDHVRVATNTRPLDDAHVDATGSMVATPQLAHLDSLPSGTGSAPPLPPHAWAFDEGKLRSALDQLLGALLALHTAEKIHRDVKPSNIVVRNDGHLFLLDFGLAVETHSTDHLTAVQGVLGTPAYMAPEQAANSTVGPAADIYSVGVVLFEAMTGLLPFYGTPMKIMMEKQQKQAPRLRTLVPEIPADLDDLVARMLSFDPRDRPTASSARQKDRREEVRGKLSAATDTHASTTTAFVGRHGELAVLEAAFKRVRGGEAAIVVLEGQSGAGKSFLARRFIDRVSLDYPSLIVVSGRCYENESVPYNAWDGALEGFSSYWQRLRPENATALLPTYIVPLVQTFPALRRVRVVSRAAAAVRPALVPREVQRRAFTALREVFSRATQTAPLLLFLDDLQWADDDSLMLLGAVLEEPSPPPMLLVATARPLSAFPRVERLLGEVLPKTALRCPVPALSHEDAVELATQLLARENALLEGRAEEIASEAGGHAFFVAELARHVVRDGGATHTRLTLEDALLSRVLELPDGARALVTVLALAARPLPEVIAIAAAELEPADAQRVVSQLRIGHLTKSAKSQGVVWLETYHDRLRNAVADGVSTEEKLRIFEQIAMALEGSSHADANMLAEYWKAAGDPRRAAGYAAAAADKACDALAFERAARLYGDAVGYSESPERERALLRKQADALSNAGELAAAGEILVRLAAAADSLEAVDLKRNAAELFVCSGRFEQGYALLRETLATVGERFPTTGFALLFWLVVARAMLRIRGVRPRQLAATTLSPHDRTRIYTLWSAGTSLSMTDNARGAYFMARTLLRTLDSGDPAEILLPLCMEACFVSSEGRHTAPRAAELAARAAEMAALDSRPVALTSGPFVQGWLRYMLGEWPASRERLAVAETIMRDSVVGYRFQLGTFRTILYRALVAMGRFEELRERLPSVYRDARHQNDLFALGNLQTNAVAWVGLADDDPDRAEREVTEAEARLPKTQFLLQHFYVLQSRCVFALYRGHPLDALGLLERTWPALKRSFLLRIVAVRTAAYELRARCALTVAGSHGSGRAALLRDALRCARELAAEKLVYATAHAELIHGIVAAQRRDRDAAAQHLLRAISHYDEVQMGLHAASARFCLGKVEGGARGLEHGTAAEVWAREQKVVAPERLFRVLAPWD